MKAQNFTGFFLIFVIAIGTVASVLAARQMVPLLAGLPSPGWLSGVNREKIEKDYDAALPHHKPSVRLWARVGYALFGEGANGVLIGRDGWLFSTEEFVRPERFRDTITDNMKQIAVVRDTLLAQGIEVLVIPVPSKARLYRAHLGRYSFPLYWQAQYDRWLAFMDRAGMKYVDLRHVLGSNAQDDYLKNDTHWSPEGARRAAGAVALGAKAAFPGLKFEKKYFMMKPMDTHLHEGDLLRFVVVDDSGDFGVTRETVRRYALETGETEDLFGDPSFAVVLVGTSYSANPLWGFENFLKEAFQTDILGVADEGVGPFDVMRRYLSGESFKMSPPQLILWEFPERYLPVAYKEPVLP